MEILCRELGRIEVKGLNWKVEKPYSKDMIG